MVPVALVRKAQACLERFPVRRIKEKYRKAGR